MIGPEGGRQMLLTPIAAAILASANPAAPGWTPDGTPRPTPQFIYVRLGCFGGQPTCPSGAWDAWLQERGERPLRPVQGGRSYRWLWYRSFHPNLILRLDVTAQGNGRLTRVWMDSHGRFSGQMRQAAVSRAAIARFEAAAIDAGFEAMSAEQSDDGDSACMDGSDWVIEQAAAKGYRYVHRDCAPDPTLEKVGRAFIALASGPLPSPSYQPIY